MSIRNCVCSLFVFMAALILITGQAMSETKTGQDSDDAMGTLVTAEWLSRHLDDTDLVILDCTVRMVPKEGGGMDAMSGRGDYDKGHIPSALFADLMGDLSDLGSPMGYALPTPEQFCKAMGALGVGDDSRVVLYDSYGSVWAARVWWMLRWVGFDNAAILDGGQGAWTAAGRTLSTDVAEPRMKKLTADPRPELIADRDEVFAAIEDDAVLLIDAMPEPHYKGQMVMYARPGHIPGAVNIPALGLLDETGCYRPHDELAAMHEGVRKGRVITYCGGGIAASSSAFILHRLGYKDVAVYIASLQEWAADDANPMVVD